MKTFDVPEWITDRLKAEGLSNSGYLLYGAGRALGFVRMSAYTLDLDVPSSEFKVAEYHAYTGISAARTAIDAVASWLNHRLELSVPQGNQVNLSREKFRAKVLTVHPEINGFVLGLGTLGTTIDEHRQRAQHQEGLAIIHYMDSKKTGMPVGWHLMPKGLSGDRSDDVRLADLLKSWADEIEGNLREIHKVVVKTLVKVKTQNTNLKADNRHPTPKEISNANLSNCHGLASNGLNRLRYHFDPGLGIDFY